MNAFGGLSYMQNKDTVFQSLFWECRNAKNDIFKADFEKSSTYKSNKLKKLKNSFLLPNNMLHLQRILVPGFVSFL
jgi:hypothetical protein